MDRFLIKKGKPAFLDDKLKPKQRFKALQTALDALDEEEQLKFFQENDMTAYNVTFDLFHYKCNKLREKSGSYSKDVAELFEALAMLKKILVFCKAKLKTGWQMRSIMGILETLVSPGNQEQLRQEGLALMLQYLSEKEQDVRELIEIYAATINLNVFDSFTLPTPRLLALSDCVFEFETGLVSQYNHLHAQDNEGLTEGKGKLNPSMSQTLKKIVVVGSEEGATEKFERGAILVGPPSTIVSETRLFNDVLEFISTTALQIAETVTTTELTDKKIANTVYGESGLRLRNTWSMLKSHYLRYLFPVTSKKISSVLDDNEGFASCPPTLLQSLIDFILSNCVQQIVLTPTSTPKDISKALIQTLLLNDEKNRELVIEILRQSMLLPIEYYETTRHAIYILAHWIIVPVNSRLPFLEQELASHDLMEESDGPLHHATYIDYFVFRVIGYIRLVFLDRLVLKEDLERVSMVHRDAIHLCRAIAAEQHLVLHKTTWEFMMKTLTEIHAYLLTDEKQVARNSQHAGQARWLGVFAETIMIVWIRSRTKSEVFWKLLLKTLSMSTTSPEFVKSWAVVMAKLAQVVHLKVYDMDLSEGMGPEEPRSVKTNRRVLSGQKVATINSVSISVTSDSPVTPSPNMKPGLKCI